LLRGLPGRRGDPVEFLKRAGRKYVEFGLKNPGAYEFAFILRRPGEGQRPHVNLRIPPRRGQALHPPSAVSVDEEEGAHRDGRRQRGLVDGSR